MTVTKLGVAVIAAAITATGSGCGFIRATAHDSDELGQIARQVLSSAEAGRTLVDQPAATREISSVLQPLETVEVTEQRDTLKTACEAFNLYQL